MATLFPVEYTERVVFIIYAETCKRIFVIKGVCLLLSAKHIKEVFYLWSTHALQWENGNWNTCFAWAWRDENPFFALENDLEKIVQQDFFSPYKKICDSECEMYE